VRAESAAVSVTRTCSVGPESFLNSVCAEIERFLPCANKAVLLFRAVKRRKEGGSSAPSKDQRGETKRIKDTV